VKEQFDNKDEKREDGFSVSLRGDQNIRFWRPVVITEWIEDEKEEVPIHNEQ